MRVARTSGRRQPARPARPARRRDRLVSTCAALRILAVLAALLALVGTELPLLSRSRTVFILIDASDSLGPAYIEAERAAALAAPSETVLDDVIEIDADSGLVDTYESREG